jgi:hypothetical protein
MEVIFPPSWFVNADISIEVISFVTILIFSVLCIKNYKISKDKKFLWLGGSFGLMTLAQLIITITKIVLYSDASFIGMGGQVIVPYNLFNFVSVFYSAGFFIFRVLILFGLYTIYKNPDVFEKESLLVLFFVIIAAIFSREAEHIFHLASLAILLLIITKYWRVYKSNESKGTLTLIVAFSGLALSNAIFIFARSMSFIYVAASIISLASYIALLALIISILEHGKTKQNKYNI